MRTRSHAPPVLHAEWRARAARAFVRWQACCVRRLLASPSRPPPARAARRAAPKLQLSTKYNPREASRESLREAPRATTLVLADKLQQLRWRCVELGAAGYRGVGPLPPPLPRLADKAPRNKIADSQRHPYSTPPFPPSPSPSFRRRVTRNHNAALLMRVRRKKKKGDERKMKLSPARISTRRPATHACASRSSRLRR